MDLIKPLLLNYLKKADYNNIIGLIIQAKTGNASAINKISPNNIEEIVRGLDWVVTLFENDGQNKNWE